MGKVPALNLVNLRIARENIGFDTSFVSGRISATKKDVVADWESGKNLPTWSQLKKISHLYEVSELLLLSSEEAIPHNKRISDFRTGTEKDDSSEIGVKKLVNLVIARQRWLEGVLREEGFKKNKVQGLGGSIENPQKLAELISVTLKIDLDEIKNFMGKGARKKALDYIISKAEAQGIFIGKTISFHRIEVEAMRGLFVSNDYCPFIVINRADSLSAQIFSLIHELAHLFKKSDGISNSLDFRAKQGSDPEEIFCNRVAVELLLPASEFKLAKYEKKDIDSLSVLYKLSPLAIFYRLKELGKIRVDEEKQLERDIQRESKEAVVRMELKKSESGGGDYNNAMRDSNGSLFNRVVLNHYLERRLNYIEASGLLKFNVEKA